MSVSDYRQYRGKNRVHIVRSYGSVGAHERSKSRYLLRLVFTGFFFFPFSWLTSVLLAPDVFFTLECNFRQDIISSPQKKALSSFSFDYVYTEYLRSSKRGLIVTSTEIGLLGKQGIYREEKKKAKACHHTKWVFDAIYTFTELWFDAIWTTTL